MSLRFGGGGGDTDDDDDDVAMTSLFHVASVIACVLGVLLFGAAMLACYAACQHTRTGLFVVSVDREFVACRSKIHDRTHWESYSAPPDRLAVIRGGEGGKGEERVGNRKGREGKDVRG